MTAIQRVRVGDVLKLERRQVYVEPSSEYDEIGVRSFGRGIFHKERISGVTLGNKRVFRIEPGDLVISNVFGWEGAIAVASDAEVGKIGSHRFMTFTPVNDRIDTSWAAWFFLSEPGLALIRKASPGSAGRNKTLAVKRFEDLVIPLPPIEEQRRVARLIGGVATKFGGRLVRANNLADAIVPALLNREFDAKGEALVAAERVRVGDVLRPERVPVTPEPLKEYVSIGVRSFGKGIFHYEPVAGDSLGKLRFFRLVPNRLVISNIKGWEGAISLSSPADAGTIASNRFLVYDAVDGAIDLSWARWFFLSEPGIELIQRASPGSADRNRTLAVKRFEDLVIPLPPIEEQRRVARLIGGVATKFGGRLVRANELSNAVVPSLLNREFAFVA